MLKVLFIYLQLQFLIAPVVASNSNYRIPFSRMDARVTSNRKYNLANNSPSFRFRAGWKRSESRDDLLNYDERKDNFVDQNQEISLSSLDDNQKTLPSSWLNDNQRNDYIDQNQKKSSLGNYQNEIKSSSSSDDYQKTLPSSWLQLSDFIPPYVMLPKPGSSDRKRSFTPHGSSGQGSYGYGGYGGHSAKTLGKKANNFKREDKEVNNFDGTGKVMMVDDDDYESEGMITLGDNKGESPPQKSNDEADESAYSNAMRGARFGGYLGMKLKSWTRKEKPHVVHHSENKDGDDVSERRADSRPFINSRWG